MKIKLKSLGILNFKGIKFLEILFKQTTNILGANRTGKTTIADAPSWLLFGKDSKGRTDFSIKPLDKNNKTIPKIEIAVQGIFDVDGQELKIRRTLKEKWVKKRGESATVFTGNETVYEWNDTPIQLKDFEKKINSLIDENFFKLLTNPLYFQSLKWEKRREMLINLVPVVVINSPYAGLDDMDFQELVQSLKSKIKKVKEALKDIPIRIDEVHKGKPKALKFSNIKADLISKLSSLKAVEAKILDKNKVLTQFNDSRIKGQMTLNTLKFDLKIYKKDFELNSNIERVKIEDRIQLNEAESEKAESEIKSLESKIENLETQLNYQDNLKEKKLSEWYAINEKIFDPDNGFCSECDQKLPQGDVDLRQKEFLENKELRLSGINEVGKKAAFRLGELTQKIESHKIEIKSMEAELNAINVETGLLTEKLNNLKEPDIKTSAKYAGMMEDYLGKQKAYDSVKPPTIENSELRKQKNKLNETIDELKKQLEVKTVIKTAENRIKELETEEQTKAQILLDLENRQFECEAFFKEKIESLTENINKKFKFVKFKMFETQINGGEKEVCTTLINGVPFSDANSEAKLNAGLDIINVFSEHYDISAPIFIDNREGVTDIIETKAQIINLIVDPEFKTLKIE